MTRILANQTEKYMRREMILFSSSHHGQIPTTRLLTYFSIKLHVYKSNNLINHSLLK